MQREKVISARNFETFLLKSPILPNGALGVLRGDSCMISLSFLKLLVRQREKERWGEKMTRKLCNVYLQVVLICWEMSLWSAIYDLLISSVSSSSTLEPCEKVEREVFLAEGQTYTYNIVRKLCER